MGTPVLTTAFRGARVRRPSASRVSRADRSCGAWALPICWSGAWSWAGLRRSPRPSSGWPT